MHRPTTRSPRARLAIVATVIAASTALGAAPAAAAPTLAVSSTTVAVGGTVSFTATECKGLPGTSGPNLYQSVYAWIIAGSGDGARAGAFARPVGGSDDDYEVTVQGWMDPDEPAVLVVWCVLGDFSTPDGTWTVVHDYGDTPLDLTPTAAPVPSFTTTASRTTASTGQVVVVEGTGCRPGASALIGLRRGTDLTLRGPILGDAVFLYEVEAAADGSVRAEVELNQGYGDGDPYGPLDTGPYTIVASCEGEPSAVAAPPLPLTVSGTNPVGSLAFTSADGVVTVTGEGCTGGRDAVVEHAGALATPRDRAIATPDDDGGWSLSFEEASGWVAIWASCGDPLGDGFRYLAVGGRADPPSTTTTSAAGGGGGGTGSGATPPPAQPVEGAPAYAG